MPNIKAAIAHTYAKSMIFRDSMIANNDPEMANSNQIVDINEDELANYLSRFSLKGLLPTMPKILVTTYRGNDSIDTWLIAFMWGLIFVHQ